MSWNDERVEMLKAMWAEGKSASVIAKELGGVTRNAVIGKVHRLGLSNRSAPTTKSPAMDPPKSADAPASKARNADTAPADPPEAKPAPAAAEERPAQNPPARKPVLTPGQPLPPQPSANEVSAEALANLAEVERRARRLTLMQLTERTCKWPIGDPATEEFWFCGLPCQQGKPYCEAHVAVAFQPMSSRRDRKATNR